MLLVSSAGVSRRSTSLQANTWNYAFGADSALERFLWLDGKIVLLGSDHDAVTFLHYVEHIVDIPGKRVARYQVPVMENGCRVWRAMEEFDTSGDGAHANWPDRFFAKIVDSLLVKTENQLRMDGLAIGAVHDAALGKAEGTRKGPHADSANFAAKQADQESLLQSRCEVQ